MSSCSLPLTRFLLGATMDSCLVAVLINWPSYIILSRFWTALRVCVCWVHIYTAIEHIWKFVSTRAPLYLYLRTVKPTQKSFKGYTKVIYCTHTQPVWSYSLSSTENSFLLRMRWRRCFRSYGLRSWSLSLASSTEWRGIAMEPTTTIECVQSKCGAIQAFI